MTHGLAMVAGIVLAWSTLDLWYIPDCGQTVKEVVTVRIDTLASVSPIAAEEKPIVVKKVVPKKQIAIEDRPSTIEVPGESNISTIEIDSSGTLHVPVVQRVYREEGKYTAYVSGHDPKLDSLKVYRPTITKTVTKYKAPRWSITVGPGAYYDGNKVVPTYIGVTAGFVIWSK